MKKKHYRHRDFAKISLELLGSPKVFKGYLADFLSQPLNLKDKRRNPKLYEVTDLEFWQHHEDNFEKMLITIVRTISYKTNK